MAKKIMNWKTKGMNRDLSVSAFNPEFAFENMNLRLSTNEGNTFMSWVTERGTKSIPIRLNNTAGSNVTGNAIGTAVIDDTLVLFTTTRSVETDPGETYPDRIYTLVVGTDPLTSGMCLDADLFYHGDLSFDVEHPLETLTSFESDSIRKVYWVDGKNPFRMLNINEKPAGPSFTPQDPDYLEQLSAYQDIFNVLPSLNLKEQVTVNKIIGGSGKFASGVIQYALTYYRKHSCESNIFYVSGLRYISPNDRGAAADEQVDNAFEITVQKVDKSFDYLRIYSIQRTSLNGTPICKRVADLDIDKEYSGDLTIKFIDTGTVGESIDPTELLYKNREAIVPGTIEQKDNTLFLGNIKKDTPGFGNYNYVLNHTLNVAGYSLSTMYRNLNLGSVDSSFSLNYTSQLSLADDDNEVGASCAGFKVGNTYRLGIQLQDKTGRWSDPVYLTDYPVPGFNDSDAGYSQHATIGGRTGYSDNFLRLPRIQCQLTPEYTTGLARLGYRKIRPVIVFPKEQDKKNICQGVVCPTLYTENGRTNDKNCYGQSSWFFRPILPIGSEATAPFSLLTESDTIEVASPRSVHGTTIPYTKRRKTYNPKEDYGETNESAYPNDIKNVEIQGFFNSENRFKVDWNLLTFHSPDIELAEDSRASSYENTSYTYIGDAVFGNTLSDIEIQTETPKIENSASGFMHKNYSSVNSYGIVSGLFYEDAAVDDESATEIRSFMDGRNQEVKNAEKVPYRWMVYPWQRTGSINNDILRPSDLGIQSTVLKKKVISNLRIASTTYTSRKFMGTVANMDVLITKDRIAGHIWYVTSASAYYICNDELMWINYGALDEAIPIEFSNAPTLFDSIESTLIKIKTEDSSDSFYLGNIDTLLSPDKTGALFFGFDGPTYKAKYSSSFDETDAGTRKYWKLWQKVDELDGDNLPHGIYRYNPPTTDPVAAGYWGTNPNGKVPDCNSLGDHFPNLVQTKDSVRMRYKSCSHLVLSIDKTISADSYPEPKKAYWYLPIFEINKNSIANIYGGSNLDALKSNTWIVSGKEVRLGNISNNNAPYTILYFDYGDMYYQRYDCLKTYAYSPEDLNQVVEIGSFMLEGYHNIDGRYDRNRGQINNLNMSPQNFNLINPVYSQPNNFFSYKIVDDEANQRYINYLTWSKNKTSGEDIDQWTYLTLAASLELEGNKGSLNCLKKFRNQLFAFQDRAIAQVLYNESVQISATSGVPIEIANSGKVEGYRYLTNTIGCSNKHSLVESSFGLYFIDSINKAIYLFSGEFSNLSVAGGFNSWSKQNIPNTKSYWTPRFNSYKQASGDMLSGITAVYDKANQEVLFINKDTALAWNEKVQAFTSFYSYKDTPYLVTLGDYELWLRLRDPGDPEGETTITNVWQHQGNDSENGYCNFFGEIRGYWTTLIGNPEPTMDKTFTNLEFRACVEGDGEYDGSTGKFTPALPFDTLEVWNEYQHGIANLQNSTGHDLYKHASTEDASPASLIRKFRMWRCDIPRDNAIVNYSKEAPMGISRTRSHPLSRMRNPWLYLNIKKQPLLTYKCQTIDRSGIGIKGFIIPISEFIAYREETGYGSCRIADISGAAGTISVGYDLIDTTQSNAYRATLDNQFWNRLPLPNVDINDLVTQASQYSADAVFVYTGNWGCNPAGLELTIYRPEVIRRTEIHDLALTFFD